MRIGVYGKNVHVKKCPFQKKISPRETRDACNAGTRPSYDADILRGLCMHFPGSENGHLSIGNMGRSVLGIICIPFVKRPHQYQEVTHRHPPTSMNPMVSRPVSWARSLNCRSKETELAKMKRTMGRDDLKKKNHVSDLDLSIAFSSVSTANLWLGTRTT